MPSTQTFTREQIEGVIRAFEDGDTKAASEFWAEDGVFIDPHYPDPRYSGPDEIREALNWALENIVEKPGLEIRNMWEDEESDTFAVEVDTNHIMQDGTEADFPQVFIIEAENGHVVRWQSYLPYPPSEAE